MRKYEEEFEFKTYNPELILKKFLHKEDKMKSTFFDGVLTGAYKYKPQKEMTVE